MRAARASCSIGFELSLFQFGLYPLGGSGGAGGAGGGGGTVEDLKGDRKKFSAVVVKGTLSVGFFESYQNKINQYIINQEGKREKRETNLIFQSSNLIF